MFRALPQSIMHRSVMHSMEGISEVNHVSVVFVKDLVYSILALVKVLVYCLLDEYQIL